MSKRRCNQPKHTLGPWEVHPPTVSGNSVRVCAVTQPGKDHDRHAERGGACYVVAYAEPAPAASPLANAHLIAAAPDQNAALLHCLEILSDPRVIEFVFGIGHDVDLAAGHSLATGEARAALAKSEGR
jgi:hypothetical protein